MARGLAPDVGVVERGAGGTPGGGGTKVIGGTSSGNAGRTGGSVGPEAVGHRYREQVPAPFGNVLKGLAGRPAPRHVEDGGGDTRVLDDGRGEGIQEHARVAMALGQADRPADHALSRYSWSRRTVDTHISSVRGKLGGPGRIVTVRGVGFRLGTV